MIKKLLFLSYLVWCSCICSIAQTTKNAIEPVKWSFSYELVKNNTYRLIMEAQLADDWYIYPQILPANTATPTFIAFDDNSNVTVDSITTEIGDLKEFFEKEYNVSIGKYYHTLRLETLAIVPHPNTTISGEIVYMSCSTVACIRPQPLKFQFLIK